MSKDWRPPGLKKYQKERALISEVVENLVGQSIDLEEWYVYQIMQRDKEIEELRTQLRRLTPK